MLAGGCLEPETRLSREVDMVLEANVLHSVKMKGSNMYL